MPNCGINSDREKDRAFSQPVILTVRLTRENQLREQTTVCGPDSAIIAGCHITSFGSVVARLVLSVGTSGTVPRRLGGIGLTPCGVH